MDESLSEDLCAKTPTNPKTFDLPKTEDALVQNNETREEKTPTNSRTLLLDVTCMNSFISEPCLNTDNVLFPKNGHLILDR